MRDLAMRRLMRVFFFVFVLALGFVCSWPLAVPVRAMLLDESEISEGPLSQILWMEDSRMSGRHLLAFLADPDPAVRGRAALAVGRIGRPRDSVALVPLLSDREPAVRRQAAFALGEIGDSSAAPPVSAILLSGNETDPDVRALCAEALGKLRWGPDACRKALEDSDPMVVVAALHAAWRIPGADPLDAALSLSSRPDPEIRRAATCCLMRLAGTRPAGRTAVPQVPELPAQARERTSGRLTQLALDPDPQTRIYATRGLATFLDPSVTEFLTNLIRDPDWRIRVETLRALASPGRDVPVRVVQPLLEDRNINVRVTAVEALGTLGPPGDAVRKLKPILRHRQARLRQAAFLALLERYRAMGDPMPGPAIDAIEEMSKQMLAQKDWGLRILAADGASVLPIELSLPILETLVRDEPRVAKAAIEPLLQRRARMRNEPLLAQMGPDLERLVSAPDPVLRGLTIETLGKIFADTTLTLDPSDWMGLESILVQSGRYSVAADPVPDVREAMVEVAGQHSTRPEMIRILETSCEDPNYLVRNAACEAMRAAGRTPPRDPEPAETGMRPDDYIPVLAWARSDHWAVIETEEGSISVRLFSREAPLTCWNFACLARDGFFDRSEWHRVVPDFVLQAGCSRGDGFGGSERTIRCEINRERFTTGTLGMALSGKDTGSSQFFLTHSDQPHLDGRYTVFGRIEAGQEIADRLIQGANLWSVRVVDKRP